MPAINSIENGIKILNKMGAAPKDIIAILQAMSRAGALQAQLEVI
ncbi:Flagellar P-ring protein [Candidatus Magnetomorum sp. HK-1]|nr:Flagellar P-ring protein [Candidatus Magnetomorum sp. HK-1]